MELLDPNLSSKDNNISDELNTSIDFSIYFT